MEPGKTLIQRKKNKSRGRSFSDHKKILQSYSNQCDTGTEDIWMNGTEQRAWKQTLKPTVN